MRLKTLANGTYMGGWCRNVEQSLWENAPTKSGCAHCMPCNICGHIRLQAWEAAEDIGQGAHGVCAVSRMQVTWRCPQRPQESGAPKGQDDVQQLRRAAEAVLVVEAHGLLGHGLLHRAEKRCGCDQAGVCQVTMTTRTDAHTKQVHIAKRCSAMQGTSCSSGRKRTRWTYHWGPEYTNVWKIHKDTTLDTQGTPKAQQQCC